MKILLFANTDWYLWNFRRELAAGIRDLGWSVVLVSPPGNYSDRFATLGFKWIPLKMDRLSTNPLQEMGVVAALAGIYRRERPDVVHHFTLKSVIHGSLAARLAGISRIVNAVAGLGYLFSSNSAKARLLRPPVRALMKLALGGARTRTIFQNPDDLTEFLQAGLLTAGQSVLIRGSGVDTRRFLPLRDGQSGPCRILLATRLLWNKGVGEYVAAAKALKEAGIDADFLIAGTPDLGNPDAVPEDVIRTWDRDGIIKWLGHVDGMERLLGETDIVVLPSRYAEGVPRVLLEAASAGAALVATDRPGCREIVVHDVTGKLVAPGDVDDLTATIRSLIADKGLRTRLGAAAMVKAKTEFEERNIIAATIDVYRQVLEQPAGGGRRDILPERASDRTAA